MTIVFLWAIVWCVFVGSIGTASVLGNLGNMMRMHSKQRTFTPDARFPQVSSIGSSCFSGFYRFIPLTSEHFLGIERLHDGEMLSLSQKPSILAEFCNPLVQSIVWEVNGKESVDLASFVEARVYNRICATAFSEELGAGHRLGHRCITLRFVPSYSGSFRPTDYQPILPFHL